MFQRYRLWPHSNPHVQGMKAVSGGHSVHFRACGRTTGKPVVILHGGPGRGVAQSTWGFFNPRVWRIILIDQRACGESTPLGSLNNNTTSDLIADLEAIREHLAIDKWTVFGSGWGSFLALAYAIAHPTSVTELLVNDILLFRRKEVDWLFKYGASEHFPDAWERFLSPLKEEERSNPLSAYYRIFTEGSDSQQREAVIGWSTWQSTTSGNPNMSDDPANYQLALALARIECHYFYHQAFLKSDSEILDNISVLQNHNILGIIVHGECGLVNPIAHARELHLAWPEAEFVPVPGAGHSTGDPKIQAALLAATQKLGGCGCLFKWTNRSA